MELKGLDLRWDVTIYDAMGQPLWGIRDKKNRLVDTGEKAIVDSFFRGNASSYFGMTDFWVGLYNGSTSDSTVLLTIPSEPSGNGYSRQKVERSATGWPTIEKDDGDWRVVSKEVSLTADGGSIGPINGLFLATSSDNTGTLISTLSFGIERTVLAGDSIAFFVKAKMK